MFLPGFCSVRRHGSMGYARQARWRFRRSKCAVLKFSTEMHHTSSETHESKRVRKCEQEDVFNFFFSNFFLDITFAIFNKCLHLLPV